MITLKSGEVTKELFDTAQFFAYAPSGSMGDAGSVIIVTDEGETYYCNYIYGDVSVDEINNAFPVWLKAPWHLPEDWVFFDLGMGNSLLVRKEHQAAFESLADGNTNYLYLFENWHRFAVRICDFLWDKGVIHLNQEDIQKELFDQAQFFFWADPGAMGDHGAVYIITEDRKTYYCNYVYGDDKVSAESISEAFPVRDMWYMHKLPEEWAYFPCNMGNHLLIRKKYKNNFRRFLGREHPYRAWHRTAMRVLASQE